MDRFAKPEAKDHERKRWFEALAAKPPVRIERWPVGADQELLYAQLQSRLMVNMAGGTMENAGLCLDRFGMPYIPGSAVKGCARRMAIQQLLEAQTSQAKTNILVQIALAFGWTAHDWSTAKKDGRFVSDFAYGAGSEHWPTVSTDARPRLPSTDSFAGSVSFLPAHAVDVSGAELPLRPPSLGTLELDVLTCHHPNYYGQKKDRTGKPLHLAALDDEDPNPVIFPAIAAGHVFAFATRPLRNCSESLLREARGWLAAGLAAFGLGAKTAAGYGWFDSSDEVQRLVTEAIGRRQKQESERRQREAETAAQKAREEADRKRREEDKAALAALSPEQQEDYKLGRMTPDQFRSALDDFARKTAEEQKAIVRALRLPADSPASRRAFWDDLKMKAQKKGGKPAQTEQAIRQLSKTMFPGKEGKMP
jgi:CRISPR type III-B/RAMP module RAMP protein Cmr6